MVQPENFRSMIKNLKVKSVSRRAKIIVIELTGDKFLLVHLKMTGQLIYVDRAGRASGGGHPINSKDIDLHKPNKFTRIILDFKDSSHLLFHDVRKFGWMKIVDKKQLAKINEQFGVEPLSGEFTLKKFKEILERRPNLKIKQLLMTQELIAGIGNIYADESLFAAGISPLRQAKTLKPAEIKKLHQAIVKKLKAAVKLGGTSVNTFVHPSGERGRFVEKLKVYGRGGQKCLRCKSILKKIKLAGRGTVYCPNCQK
jgi:formamidopyrimidine-DNA glycosylase